MGFADGYYYGQGKFLVNASLLTAGDIVRVRSMTDNSKVWNKTVVLGDTILIFDVPCKDYYKISLVQNIGGVDTEVINVYKTVDYGQTFLVDVLNKTSLGGVQGILNAHQETSMLAVGDEVTVKVNGVDWIMQIAGIDIYNSHEVIFVSKHIWDLSTKQYSYSSSNDLRPKAQAFYSGLDNNDKQYIKQVTRYSKDQSTVGTYDDYCYILGNKETANGNYGKVDSQIQMPLFVTQANRVKYYNGTAKQWWTSDYQGSASNVGILANGSANTLTYSDNYGVVPAFTLLADS